MGSTEPCSTAVYTRTWRLGRTSPFKPQNVCSLCGGVVMTMADQRACSWCKGTGRVASGDGCWSCRGTGYYTPAPASAAVKGLAFSVLMTVLFLVPTFDSYGWRLWRHSACLFFGGTSLICLATYLRGSAETGWNWLMLIGTLIAAAGLLFAPASLIGWL